MNFEIPLPELFFYSLNYAEAEADIERRNSNNLRDGLAAALEILAECMEICPRCLCQPRLDFNPPPLPSKERWVASCGCNHCYHDELKMVIKFWNAGLHSSI